MFFQAPADGGAWDGTNGHFTQWHPDNGSGSASLGLWSYGDGWLVGLNPEGDGDVELEDLGMPIEVGAWQDVVMHVDWDEGIVEVWVNGVQELAAANVDFASGPGQSMKLGINRWGSGPDGSPADDDWVIFYDAFRIGASWRPTTTSRPEEPRAGPCSDDGRRCGSADRLAASCAGLDPSRGAALSPCSSRCLRRPLGSGVPPPRPAVRSRRTPATWTTASASTPRATS